MESFRLFLFTCSFLGQVACQSIPFVEPSSCQKNPLPGQFFDISSLSCKACGEHQQPRADQLTCECVSNAKLVSDVGGLNIKCELCPENQVATSDGYDCVECPSSAPYDAASKACALCGSSEIAVDRKLDGRLQDTVCVLCLSGTQPQAGVCHPCSPTEDISKACLCDVADSSCGAELVPVLTRQTSVVYPTLDLTIGSFPFVENFPLSEALCRLYSNVSACQVLANLCVLLHYNKDLLGGNLEDACTSYITISNLRLNRGSGNPLPEWPETMPWLYYTDEDILTSNDIQTSFSFSDSDEQPASLYLIAAAYSFNGTFLGLSDAGPILQLCDDRSPVISSAYQIGTDYTNKCDLRLAAVISQPTIFYDLYLKDKDQLFPVPVLNKNYREQGAYVNAESDSQQWQLTRRFFLVDSISGVRASGQAPSTIRVADSIQLQVKLRSDGDGHIYPPLLHIHYKEISGSEVTASSTTSVSFSVIYSADTGSFDTGIRVTIGIMSGLAFLYTILLVHGWRRRNGKETLDFSTITTFFFLLCGTLASSYFWILFSSGAYWLLFFKGQQKVSILLPTSSQESQFVSLLIAMFVLKVLHIFHIIWRQVNVDVFFIDWEKPRGDTTRPNAPPPVATEEEQTAVEMNRWRPGGGQNPVSIWRTYFIANEWNELQTLRKINGIFQLLVVLFFLEVVGFSDVCRHNPHAFYSLSRDDYPAPFSRLLRFAMAVIIYIIIAIIQWVFFVFIYERFVQDKIREFVDVCSMANVSVFVMQESAYGYYIHGRSVHGRSDTDMWEMHQQLKREEEDLCGKRGLLPDTDQQTFEMALTLKIRQQYDRLMLPVREQLAHGLNSNERTTRGRTTSRFNSRVLQAYFIMNRFLSAFIDHALRDFSYMVKDKLLLERLMGIEFNDPIDKALFYNDDGHGFNSVLLYGNEWNLLLFDMVIFTFTDVFASDFVLAAFVTYIVGQLLVLSRDSLGRRNLARKTLVDERFLI
jgi:meckelin